MTPAELRAFCAAESVPSLLERAQSLFPGYKNIVWGRKENKRIAWSLMVVSRKLTSYALLRYYWLSSFQNKTALRNLYARQANKIYQELPPWAAAEKNVKSRFINNFGAKLLTFRRVFRTLGNNNSET